MLTVIDYMQYCQANRYFTCGSANQYEQAFLLVRMLHHSKNDRAVFRRVMLQLATVTWICSDSDYGMTVQDFEQELYRLYVR